MLNCSRTQFAVPMYFDFVKELPKVSPAAVSYLSPSLTTSSDVYRKCVAIAPCSRSRADPFAPEVQKNVLRARVADAPQAKL